MDVFCFGKSKLSVLFWDAFRSHDFYVFLRLDFRKLIS